MTAQVPYDGVHLPVLLIHGMHARDKNMEHSDLWGRVPDWLRDKGYPAWFGNEDAWGDVERNAHELARSVDIILERTGAPKVHVVAHSKGGFDAHRLTHLPGMHEKIASVTTLGAPMHGLRLCTFLLHIPLIVAHVVAPIMNRYARKLGDEFPDSLALLRCLSHKQAEAFIVANPPFDDIDYRSYAFAAWPDDHRKFHLNTFIIKLFDGENDGIAPLGSTEYINWIVVRVQRGVNFTHDDSCDLFRRDIEFTTPDGTVYPSILYLIGDAVDELNRSYLAGPSCKAV